jgi:hypothetical protein
MASNPAGGYGEVMGRQIGSDGYKESGKEGATIFFLPNRDRERWAQSVFPWRCCMYDVSFGERNFQSPYFFVGHRFLRDLIGG